MKDMAGLMQQAQKMQDNIKRAQEELESVEVQGESGAGMVKVTMTGKGEVKRIAIDPSLANAEEVEVLEDLLVAASNDAKRKVEEVAQEAMQNAAGGLAGMMPPGFKLPF